MQWPEYIHRSEGILVGGAMAVILDFRSLLPSATDDVDAGCPFALDVCVVQ